MALEATQAAHTSDQLNPSGSVFDESAASETAAALRSRIAMLEGRELALSAELAALRADLRRLRQSLDQVRNEVDAHASVVQPILAVVPAALSIPEGENAVEASLDTVAVTVEDSQSESLVVPDPAPADDGTDATSLEETPSNLANDSGETAATTVTDAYVTVSESNLDVGSDLVQVDLSHDCAETDSRTVADGGEAERVVYSDEAELSPTESLLNGEIGDVPRLTKRSQRPTRRNLSRLRQS